MSTNVSTPGDPRAHLPGPSAPWVSRGEIAEARRLIHDSIRRRPSSHRLPDALLDVLIDDFLNDMLHDPEVSPAVFIPLVRACCAVAESDFDDSGPAPRAVRQVPDARR